MPDNVGYTAGTGTKVASREVNYSGETAQAQVVGLATFSGPDDAKVISDVDANNPLPVVAYGELVEAVEALRSAVQSLTRTVGMGMPDALGRLRVLAENPTAANLAMTASIASGQTLATLTTLSTLTNQTQIGGFNANDQIPALVNAAAASLRRNISVT